jgi:hypothetical protein
MAASYGFVDGQMAQNSFQDLENQSRVADNNAEIQGYSVRASDQQVANVKSKFLLSQGNSYKELVDTVRL